MGIRKINPANKPGPKPKYGVRQKDYIMVLCTDDFKLTMKKVSEEKNIPLGELMRDACKIVFKEYF